MSDQPTLPRIWTLDEAAEYLRMTPRALAKIARRIGACSINGRDLLLSDDDIRAVWEEMRAPPRGERRAVKAGPSDQAYERLLKRALERRTRKKA